MSEESSAALLQAYKYATEADQDGIADLLETVILELMGERTSPIVIGHGHRNAIDPPWKVEAAPLSVPRSYTVNTTMECTGIDPMTKEASK